MFCIIVNVPKHYLSKLIIFKDALTITTVLLFES